MFTDHDRDGYPDAIVGRSGRNYNTRLKQANFKTGGSGQTTISVPAHQDTIYGGRFTLGGDGYRQDQIGYRDRLRGRMAAAAQVLQSDGGDEFDARTLAMASMPVPSHGGTGVPGGNPGGIAPGTPPPASLVPRYTPTQQAMMAPRTIPPGMSRNPPRKLIQPQAAEAAQTGLSPETASAQPHPGNEGPFLGVRQPSYGNVPTQGTGQSDGSFKVAPTGAAPDAAAPSDEPATRTVERTRTVTRTVPVEHGKPHEHHRPHEHTRPPEHKK